MWHLTPLPCTLSPRFCHRRRAECDNRERVTPLHSAALGGCPRCAQALLEAGADAGLADGAGRLPADLAPEQVGAEGTGQCIAHAATAALLWGGLRVSLR